MAEVALLTLRTMTLVTSKLARTACSRAAITEPSILPAATASRPASRALIRAAPARRCTAKPPSELNHPSRSRKVAAFAAASGSACQYLLTRRAGPGPHVPRLRRAHESADPHCRDAPTAHLSPQKDHGTRDQQRSRSQSGAIEQGRSRQKEPEQRRHGAAHD